MSSKRYTVSLFIGAALLVSSVVFGQTEWKKISSGVEFSIGLKSNGTIWAWGNNSNGQLGIGSTVQKQKPVQIGTDTDWKTIDAGSFHVLAIKNNGTLWSWGLNSVGQLGNGGTTADVNAPVQVGSDTNWDKVIAGFAQSFAIKSDSSLWAWGYNTYNTLGLINPADPSVPNQVMPGSKWLDCSSGGAHTLAIQSDSTLWAWGYNATGQIGNGSTTQQDTPLQIDATPKWISVSAGFEFSMALTSDQKIYTWGWNGNGQLGTGNTQSLQVPTLVAAATNFDQIAAGSAFAFGISDDHTLYGWGYNGKGQLGNGTTTQINTPTQIGNDSDWAFINAAKGTQYQNQIYGFHSVGLKLNSYDRCFSGANYVGQLGNNSMTDILDFTCNDDNLGLDSFTAESVRIYPNPAVSTLSVEFKSQQTELIELVSLQGTVLRTVLIHPGVNSLDVSSLSPGVYLLKGSDSVISFLKN